MAATIEIAKTDITRLAVDAIVNPANEALQLGSGVAGAIRQNGGPTIQEDCDLIGRLATDPNKRELFKRLAVDLRAMASDIRTVIATRTK